MDWEFSYWFSHAYAFQEVSADCHSPLNRNILSLLLPLSVGFDLYVFKTEIERNA